MEDMKVINLPIDSVIEYANNTKEHTQEQIEQLKTSIQKFGYSNPILVDEKNMLLAGHGRLQAMRELGRANIPSIRIEHLSDLDKKKFIIADNKIAMNTQFNQEALLKEIHDILELDDNAQTDLISLGMDAKEIDVLLDSADMDIEDFTDVEEYNESNENSLTTTNNQSQDKCESDSQSNNKEHIICPHCGKDIYEKVENNEEG